ncbi:MAG: phosphomannomutase/phosphoglucomutase [gamma proteobacterium symbiont of Taylorina sp.]|nr:phosphomannomutase/phosphoglucomutase [gamma proteobacterium symbiont of Taylorina sp.]
MIEIKDTKDNIEVKDPDSAKEAKDKVASLLEDEKINKSKESSTEKQRLMLLKSEKTGLLRYSIISLFLFLSALALFSAAFSSKTETELQHQQQIKSQANKEINRLVKQATSSIKNQVQAFISILNNTKKIPFESAPQLEDLKSKLKSSLNNSISVQIIPSDYIDDEIIDHPDMGYTFLFLLNELKGMKNNSTEKLTKFELYKGNTKDKKLLLIQKVVNEDVAIAYVVVSLSTDFMQHLFADIKFNNRYFEIIQKNSSASFTLLAKGDSSLKTLPIAITKNLHNTPWIIKYWDGEQLKLMAVELFWLAFLYLSLAVSAAVIAMILLVIVIKKYRLTRAVNALPATQDNKNESFLAKLKPGKSDDNKQEAVDIKVSAEMQKIADNIFRTNDIRGIVGEFINTDVLRAITRVIAGEMRNNEQRKMVIACDGRNSSPQLVKAVIETLLENGIDVINIGMVGTPVLYFSALNHANGNGLMITASHNPANYNGMKIMLSGHAYSDDKLQLLKQKFIKDKSDGLLPDKAGNETEVNALEEYINKVSHDIKLSRPMKIVIDTCNGVTGKYAAALFKQLNCDVSVLNEEVDGNFPAHTPDPGRPENLTELSKKVVKLKADIGIAFDGDGDRLGLIASDGNIIWPDIFLMLLAKDILSRNPAATILFDVKSTKDLIDFIFKLGGKPRMCRSGHSFMKNKLKQTNALLAGEMSGHIFIQERWFGFDDASYAAARILEILSIDLRKSGHIFAELPRSMNTPEILIETSDAHAIMTKISQDTSCFDDGEIITIDGIRVEYPDGWGLVRASNTSDNLTLRFEADNEEALQRIASVFKAFIASAAPDLKFPF